MCPLGSWEVRPSDIMCTKKERKKEKQIICDPRGKGHTMRIERIQINLNLPRFGLP